MENFVPVYNIFIEENVEGNLKLTPNELYTYSYLYTLRTYKDKVLTTIDCLCEFIRLTESDRYNKDAVKFALDRLKELNSVHVEENGKRLIITFPIADNNFKYKKIPYDKVDELEPLNFFIYCAVAKWENENNESAKAKYSYSRWAKILDCSVRSGITYIDEAVEKGIIFKKTGRYTDNNMQEINTYSTTPFAQVEEMTPQVEIEVEDIPTSQKEVNTDITEMTPSELYEFITGMTEDDEFIEFIAKMSQRKARSALDELIKYKSLDDLLYNERIFHIYTLSLGMRTCA